eukprot:jgi/Undpi1/3829/HiC_scaffold_16.g07198.m1
MRPHLHIAASAVLLAGTAIVQAHPGCFTKDETPTLDATLTFCELEPDGACCTPTQESDAIAVFNLPGPLTGQCAEDYAKVACGPCSAYAGHLYERLGAELGVSDGMTMKSDFCNGMVEACAGQIAFPTYDGGSTSYCQKHVGDSDLIWSYPIDESETTFESTGLVEAFPSLSGDDLPRDTIAMHMTPDGSRWWLAGQDGDIKEVSADNPTSSTEILDLADLSIFYRAFEEGLLDFAFDPNFHSNDVFYVSYTVENDGRFNRLSQFTLQGSSAATLGVENVVLESAAKDTSIHSAGWCGFKPSAYASPSSSNELYWAIGDGGPQEDPLGVGQDLSTLLGKIVRISVSGSSSEYTIPSGNMGGGLPEICASGFRNPFRCGFDKDTDELYCGDVGHTLVEELDLVVCGQDYGWSTFEGSRCQQAQQDRIGSCDGISRSGVTFPIYEYCHPDYDSTDEGEDVFTNGNDLCGARSVTGLAVIGGYPYRGQRFSEVLTGALLFADAQKKNLYYLVNEGGGEWVPGTIIGDGSTSIISFAEDNDGEQYVITSDRVPHQLPCGDLCATTCLAQAETQPVYESLGCFADFSNDRALTVGSSAACDSGQDLMSPAICASYCATITGSTLFGVQYAFECFCGGPNDDYDKHGSLGMDQCETLCTGTPDEFCGGTNAMEVYSFSEGVPQTPAPLADMIPSPTVPTPTVDPNTDYTSVDCFVDDKNNRVLSTLAYRTDTNTIEACAAACIGSTYFGTEYGTECFCSVAGDDPAELGTATCGTACTGDSSQICGGTNAIFVYEYGETTITPTPQATTPTPQATTPTATGEADYEALDCYADLASPRVLTDGVQKGLADLTPEVCAELCAGNTYFGLQYGTECWCGGADTDIDANGLGVCDMPCTGDPDVDCGGFFAFNAYQYTDVIVVPPTPTGITVTDLGCYEDSKGARIMGSLTTNSSMTVELCSDYCQSIYFGLQYGIECWCSDTTSFEAIGSASNCDYDCGGDSSQNCGGYNAMHVYENTG